MDTIETYKAVFDAAPDGVVITDHLGKILLTNNQVVKLFGYEKEELIGQEIELLVPKRFHTKHIEQRGGYIVKPTASGMGVKNELLATRKDGSEIAVEVSLSPIKIGDKMLLSAAIRDVTERKAIERKIIESEKRLHDTLNNMLEGVQIISYDFRYLYVNDAVVKQSGYSREELVGYTMMEKYPGIESTKMFSVLQKCMNIRTGQYMVNEFTFPDSSKRSFELNIQPSPEGLFILSVDITERKKNELEIVIQNKKLKIQNMELEQFTYIASHDLQEPLRTLISFAALIKEEYAGKMDLQCDKYLDFICQSSKRMQELVKGSLDYSRIGKERELTNVDCNQIIQDVLSDMSVSIKESDAQITVLDLPKLNGYSIELRQLFQNLISNSLKFKKKGIIPEITVSATKQADDWLFSVRDNGIGIDQNDKDKIFVIFKRLHNRNEYEGTGIGLSNCKKIVEMHGGNIWVDSKPGEGSLFNFTIPQQQ